MAVPEMPSITIVQHDIQARHEFLDKGNPNFEAGTYFPQGRHYTKLGNPNLYPQRKRDARVK